MKIYMIYVRKRKKRQGKYLIMRRKMIMELKIGEIKAK